MTNIDPLVFYDHLGPARYNAVTRELDWHGPRDMARMLENVPMQNAVIADFAIGTGPLSNTFRRAGARRIIGIDGSSAYLNYCLANNRADEVELCDLVNEITALPDASADISTCSGLFSYLSDITPLVWELTRVTRPGGHIAINFHPAAGMRRTEHIPAGAICDGASLDVIRHSDCDVIACFRDSHAILKKYETNPSAITRYETGHRAPLTTHLYAMPAA